MATDATGAMPRYQTPPLDQRSIYLRRLVVRALEGGGRGHIGSSLSLIEIMRVLYDDVLRFRPTDPVWAERDRCILSKGHGCLAQYVMLADKGFFPIDVLDGFCRYDSILGGHPEAAKIPGVEASTGALGHGLPIGVGRALGLRMKRQDARVFVITGDGEINEGSVWEAALSASKHRLSNLVVMIDYNKIQSAGATAEIHDVEPLRRLLCRVPLDDDRPTAIVCHTIKGKGIAFTEDDADWHHKSSLKAEVIADMYAALGVE